MRNGRARPHAVVAALARSVASVERTRGTPLFWGPRRRSHTIAAVHTPRLLADRSLEGLLYEALSARAEGLVALRDRDGFRHGIWVQHGYVVGAHVASRFDPLLELLARAGGLDRRTQQRCMSALYESDARCGHVAQQLACVPEALVRDTLKLQLAGRYAALMQLADLYGHDALLEAGPVPPRALSIRLPLGSLLRAVERLDARPPSCSASAASKDDLGASVAREGTAHFDSARERARKKLRALAKALHPDLHAGLDDESRERLTAELARATAEYHGFR